MKLKSIIAACCFCCLISTVAFVSCNKSSVENSAVASELTITALNCSAATFSSGFISGEAYSGTATVPYTGGNGEAYPEGVAIPSTGVTGLTATLQAGTLATGAGNLVFIIKGTPTATGTALFAISLGGQSCTLSLPMAGSATDCSTASTTAARVACLAEAFKATLTAAQITTLQIAYTKANAIRWSNLPGGVSIRNGLEFSTLTATQLAAAKAVIAAASGTTINEGFSEFSQINTADDVLASSGGGGGGGGGGYSSLKYIIAFLGTPSATGTWMLQFGGHHYAQNITYSGGATVSATPSHQGVEPRTWTSAGVTYAPLAQEATAMADLLASFTTAELASAKLTATFGDVLLGPNKDGQFPATKVGIKFSSLSAAAQAKVLPAMLPWLNDLDAEMQAKLLAIYTSELADTYVSYSGNNSGTPGNPATFLTSNADYVRIDGPSVWIEFVCQNGVVLSGIHYHSIFRDHTRDYNGL